MVGAATVAGVIVAVRTYLRNTWDTKVATARLIWAEGAGPRFAPKAGSPRYPREDDPNHPRLHPSTSGTISAPNLFKAGEFDGAMTAVWSVDGFRSYARVTNNSKEPVGEVELTLRKGNRVLAARQEPHDMPTTLAPESTALFAVLIPREGNLTRRHGRLVLEFRDSAGHRWRRSETTPPVPIPKPRAQQFPAARAGWFRRRLQLRRSVAATKGHDRPFR
jgi:hypothetical protein